MTKFTMKMVCLVCALFLVIAIHIQLSQTEGQAQTLPSKNSGNAPQLWSYFAYEAAADEGDDEMMDEDEDEEVLSCDYVFCYEDFEVLGPCEYGSEDPWYITGSNNAGGDPPEAYLDGTSDWLGGERMGFYNVNTSSVLTGCCLYLQFYQGFSHYGGVFQLNVYARDSIGSPFTQIHNQIVTPGDPDISGEVITIDITDYIGMGTAVEWELLGEPYFWYWAVDNVMIYSADCAM